MVNEQIDKQVQLYLLVKHVIILPMLKKNV